MGASRDVRAKVVGVMSLEHFRKIYVNNVSKNKIKHALPSKPAEAYLHSDPGAQYPSYYLRSTYLQSRRYLFEACSIHDLASGS